MGYGATPICMAKTQYSFSDDPTKINAPRGFTMTIREVNLSAGAGFLVALTGDVMVMPGLGVHPSAVKMEEEEY
jgi:formate--tetrahydrofolate ligase